MKRPTSVYSLATVLTVCVAFAALAPAADSPKKKTDRRIVTVMTSYLHETLEGAHQITLDADLHAHKGELTLDPNTCALNDFGDPTICTKIAPRKIKVGIHAMDLGDPSGQKRNIYDVVGEGLANKLYLVVPTKPGSSFRFVSKDRGGVKRVVTLEVRGGRETPCGGAGSPDKPMPAPGSKVQIVTGVSKKMSFDEALADAVKKLKYPFPDALLHFTVIKESGRLGSIAGLQELSVTIRATVAGE